MYRLICLVLAFLVTLSLGIEHPQVCIDGKGKNQEAADRTVNLPDFYYNPDGVDIDGNLDVEPDWNELQFESVVKSYKDIYPGSDFIAAFPMYNAGNGCGNDNTIYGNAYVFFNCKSGESENIGQLNVLVLDDPNEEHIPILTSTDDMWFKVYEAYKPQNPNGGQDITSGNFINIGNGGQVISQGDVAGWEGKALIHGENEIIANIHMNWRSDGSSESLTGGVDSVQGNSHGLKFVLPKCVPAGQVFGKITCPSGPMSDMTVQVTDSAQNVKGEDTTAEDGSFSIDATPLVLGGEYILKVINPATSNYVEIIFTYNSVDMDLNSIILSVDLSPICEIPPFQCTKMEVKVDGGIPAASSLPWSFELLEASNCGQPFSTVSSGTGHQADENGVVSHLFEGLLESKSYKYVVGAPSGFSFSASQMPYYVSDCFQVDCSNDELTVFTLPVFPFVTEFTIDVSLLCQDTGAVLPPPEQITISLTTNSNDLIYGSPLSSTGSWSYSDTNLNYNELYKLVLNYDTYVITKSFEFIDSPNIAVMFGPYAPGEVFCPSDEPPECPVQDCPLGTDIVKNGNFEIHPELCKTSWCIWDSGIQDWSVEVGQLELQDWGHNFDLHFGPTYVELDAHQNSIIYQNLPTEPGQEYFVSFLQGARSGSNVGEQGVEVFINGVTKGKWYLNPSIVNEKNVFVFRSFSFVAESGTTTKLSFAGVGVNNSLGSYIDAVSAFPVNSKFSCCEDCAKIKCPQKIAGLLFEGAKCNA